MIEMAVLWFALDPETGDIHSTEAMGRMFVIRQETRAKGRYYDVAWGKEVLAAGAGCLCTPGSRRHGRASFPLSRRS